MKGKTKKAAMLMLALILVFAMTITAFAASGTWKQNSKGWWYAYTDGGYAANKWEKISGRWYHFDSNGYMQTGWQQIGGKWYYLGTNGVMATGWQKISNKWYYFGTSGAMATGWQNINNKWYYFGTGGAMATGWQNINNKWYYFSTGGVMATGWQKISGKYYYFNSNGTVKTGWVKAGGNWYYLKSDGTLAIAETVDGNKFDDKGVWIGKADNNPGYPTQNTGVFVGATIKTINSDNYDFSSIVVTEDKSGEMNGKLSGMMNVYATWAQDVPYYYTVHSGFGTGPMISQATEFRNERIKEWADWIKNDFDQYQGSVIHTGYTRYFESIDGLDQMMTSAECIEVFFTHYDKNRNYLGFTVISVYMP